MHLADIEDKKIIILGFGREGKAMYDVLKTLFNKLNIVVSDEKMCDVPEFVPLSQLAADQQTVVIKSPGIPWHRDYVKLLQQSGAVFTSSTNLFLAERKGKGKIIGVTGTKGKSTTSSLLAHVLKAAGWPVILAGNIGEPAILHLAEPDDAIFVLEMSSYQLLDLQLAPDIAVILNLYEEHMDYHGSLSNYYATKANIALLQQSTDLFVYNQRFPVLLNLAQQVVSRTKQFVGTDDKSLNFLTLLGAHNRENAAGVLAVTDELGVDREIVERAFVSFKALPHRLQEVGSINGIKFVNDSFCTTPAAALAAIDVFEDSLGAIIVGGFDRGYDFKLLANKIVELGVRPYILLNGDRVATAIREAGGEPIMMSDFSQIIQDVLRVLQPGQVCLLSPASPSFGQFKNFVERGEQFTAAVQSFIK